MYALPSLKSRGCAKRWLPEDRDTRLPAVLQSGGTHPSMLPMSETTYRHFDMQDILLSVGHTAVSEAKRQNQCGIAKVC